jgi:hypothetical protein
MRAFRVADGSFYTWRAGAYDPAMADATPPFPKVDYSDHVQIGILGGPLARSDAEAFAVPGMGTPGTPVTLGVGGVGQTVPGTDCRDFASISAWFVVTAAPTTPAVVTLKSLWTNIDAAAVPADLGVQASDDAISAGVSPQNKYVAEYTINGTTAVEGAALGPFNVPVRGRRQILVAESSTLDVVGYMVAMRLV